ncbi:MAG: hypothetical protein QOH49_4275 [Acidobacteriota bacterium]|jgi:hypothetical protein|nr:hypothetical protein [Acidobacteriota bacterium]
MTTRARLLTAALCVATLFCAGSRAQTGRSTNTTPLPTDQAAGTVSADPVANEIALLRKSLQTLNARLREISEKLLSPDTVRTSDAPPGKQNPIAQSLDILSRAEQRAEGMRRQLLEITEKETAYRTRMMQLDDDMRSDSIDRSLSGIGTTRTPELRDLRRRQLDNERKGVEILLGQASTNRARLEEDVKQADLLVARIRQRLLPLIEREIDKLQP